MEVFVALLVGMVLGFAVLALVASYVVVHAATTPPLGPTFWNDRSASQQPPAQGAEVQGSSTSAYRPDAAAELLGERAEDARPVTEVFAHKCATCAALRRAFAAARKFALAK